MGKVSRGKQLETQVKKDFRRVINTSVDRIPDQTSGFMGSSNISDFIVYHYPYQLYIECKSCYGNTLNFKNITDTQYEGLKYKDKIHGVIAGYIVWFIDHDSTFFITGTGVEKLKEQGLKSININKFKSVIPDEYYQIRAVKRRVLFEYDFSDFFNYITANPKWVWRSENDRIV